MRVCIMHSCQTVFELQFAQRKLLYYTSRKASVNATWSMKGLLWGGCIVFQVGGMGDVVTALGRAVQEEGHHVEVILPKYDCIQYDEVQTCAC